MIHFKDYVDENGNKGVQYWFTKGVSLNDIQKLKQRFCVLCPAFLTNPDTLNSFDSNEYFPSTKKYDNIYRLVVEPQPKKAEVID